VGEGNENLLYPSPWNFKSYLYAVKYCDMVHPALFSIQKEGVLRIFIALKNPTLWPGSNPQTLGPVQAQ
jgi:hypothetical protein